MVRRMTNRWIASYEMSDGSEYLEHTGRLGMKWYQHIFGKDPAKGQKIIERKRKALSANVALAKDAARRGNAKRLAQLNKKTKKMVADVKQLEDQYESSTGKKYSSSKPGEAEDAVAQTKQTTKESILKTGSAKDVFAIKDQLTQSELQDAINRIQKENTLAGLKASEVQQKIDNAKNFTNTVINAGNTAVNAFNAYENVAKMVNTISGEDTLPVFTGRKEKASKEAEKARAKKVKGIIERSDAQEIADNIHLFTNNEVQEAKKRLDNIKAIEKQIKHSDLDISEVDDYLEHSGRKGMKWYQHIFTEGKSAANKARTYARKKKKDFETKKYKEYNADLEKVGSNVHGKTRYTNIDGSLNERGKLHSQKYINKEQNKNRKYYNKQIGKYKKLLDKYKDDPELKKKFEAMIKDAERSRDGVNKSLDKFGIQEILTNEARARDQALRIAGVIASGAALGTAGGVTAKVAGDTMLKTGLATAQAFKNFDMKAPMDSVIHIVNSTDIGKKGEMAAETAIRTYSDARSYVTGIYLDQMARRLDAMGVPQQFGNLGSQVINGAIRGVDQNAITGLGNSTTNAITSIINAGTTGLGNFTVSAINDANALNTVYGKMDYNHNNLLQAVGGMSPNDEISVMMNDPNYLNLLKKVQNYQANGGQLSVR